MEERDNYWKRKQFSRRQILKGSLALGAGAVGLTIGGCSSSTSSVSPTVKPTTGGTPAASATQVGAAKSTPKGKVTFAIATLGNESLSPFDWISAVELTPINYLFEPLIMRDLQGKLSPGLATRWANRENGQIWDFEIRKGVKFHNGDTLTAKDVKFTFDQLVKAKGQGGTTVRPYLDSVEIVDDYKVTVKLKKSMGPFATLCEAVTYVVPKDYYEKVGPEEFAKKPVGTGAFRLANRAFQQSMEFEAYENSWRQVPSIKTAVLRIVPDTSARLAMLKAKEADVVSGVTPALMKDIEATKGLRLVVSKETVKSWVWFLGASKKEGDNYIPNTKSPWLDKRVRQAANYAINREQIVQGLYQGQASPMVTLVMPTYFGFDSSIKPYPYDPSKAKALLKEAGYPDGFSTDLYAMEQSAIPYVIEMGQAVGGFLTAVGIKTNVVQMEYGTYQTKVRDHAIEGLGIISTAGQYDAWRPLGAYSKSGPWSQMADPEVDKLVADIENEGDERKREELCKKAVRKEHEDAHHLFLVYGNSIYGVNDRVADWPQQAGFGYPKWLELLTLKS